MTGFIVLVAYTLLMLGVSYLLTRRQTTLQGFLVGDRRMGTIKSAMSIAATWIWAPALFVSAEKAYSNGWPGLFWFLVPNILCLLFFIPYAERIRKQMPDGITISGYMGTIYRSVKVKRVYLAQLSILAVLSTAVQLLAGGKILSSVLGIDFFTTTVILSMIAYSYSQFSGIMASVITDAMQMVLILGCCLLLVPWALSMPGGYSALVNGLHGINGNYQSLVSYLIAG